jgi:hypothetical protein
MFTSRKIHIARAAIVVLGLTAALAATTAQGAMAKTKIDDPGGSGGATSAAAAAPTTAPPIPVAPTSMDPAPQPNTCDAAATPPVPPANPSAGVHKGVIIAPGSGTPDHVAQACDGKGTTAPPSAPAAPAPPDHGTGATVNLGLSSRLIL